MRPEDVLCDLSLGRLGEVPDGWVALVSRLMYRLAFERDVEILQIKEKYGELRCYAANETPRSYAAIREAESESRVTCQTCGEKNALLCGDTWLETLCASCAEKEDKRYGFATDD